MGSLHLLASEHCLFSPARPGPSPTAWKSLDGKSTIKVAEILPAGGMRVKERTGGCVEGDFPVGAQKVLECETGDDKRLMEQKGQGSWG